MVWILRIFHVSCTLQWMCISCFNYARVLMRQLVIRVCKMHMHSDRVIKLHVTVSINESIRMKQSTSWQYARRIQQQRGANPLGRPIFSKNYLKMKKFWPSEEWWGEVSLSPRRSANEYVYPMWRNDVIIFCADAHWFVLTLSHCMVCLLCGGPPVDWSNSIR